MNMKAKNEKAFRKLRKRYESITLEEIEGVSLCYGKYLGRKVANKLTGFGSVKSCTLCQGVECKECVYGSVLACCNGRSRETYYAIAQAILPEVLLKAFRARAKHMRMLLT